MVLVNEMMVFYYVVQLHSFSQAAERLGVSKSFVSKCITKLENDLKSRLLTRTTRQLMLTEAGEALYQHCQAIVFQAEEGYAAVAHLSGRPIGSLKISVPPAIGLHLLTPTLVAFNHQYPEVTLNVVLESRITDVIQQRYDLVLRSAILPDSNLIAQKITSLNYILCASPGYLQKHGAIQSPQQLIDHPFALYGSDRTPQPQLKLMQHQQSIHVNLKNQLQSNNLDLIKQMVLADCCIAVLPEFMVSKAITEGKLIACLTHYSLPSMPLYVLYAEKKLMPLKVKLFIDLLKSHLLTMK